jgi:hypothetical protein
MSSLNHKERERERCIDGLVVNVRNDVLTV